jgi:hypothetical protein
MRLRVIGFLALLMSSGMLSFAQDTLPAFKVVNKGKNRIIVSWNNPFGDSIRQLTIQRSFDSTRNFKSILTLPDPTVPQNGFADTKAPNEHMFYRLYILLDSGNYIFSKSKRPVLDTTRIVEGVKKDIPPAQPLQEPAGKIEPPAQPATQPLTEPVKETDKKPVVKPEPVKPKEIPERIIFVKKRDTLIAQVGERSLRRYRDSIALKTKDTVLFNTADTLVIKPFVPKEVYKPSKLVFTDRDGNVKILLPLALEKKYTLKFFEESGTPVMEIKQIKDSLLVLDKANFSHAGWFRFELYEDGQLKEKHKLYIPKDF